VLGAKVTAAVAATAEEREAFAAEGVAATPTLPTTKARSAGRKPDADFARREREEQCMVWR
jgi:hypothetical protein